jgi:hypothetical protein
MKAPEAMAVWTPAIEPRRADSDGEDSEEPGGRHCRRTRQIRDEQRNGDYRLEQWNRNPGRPREVFRYPEAPHRPAGAFTIG